MSDSPELLSFIVHELRDPLSSMLATVQSLRLAKVARDATSRRAHLDRIESNATRIEALLESIAIVAAHERREPFVPNVVTAGVAALVTDAAARARQLASRDVTLEVRGDVDASIEADRRLAHALAALACATMTFAFDGAVVAWNVGPDGEHRVRIDLPDVGLDVSDADAPRLTDSTYWESRPRAVGLGVAIRAAVIVVRAHGGTVTRSCDPDPVLRISLPRVA